MSELVGKRAPCQYNCIEGARYGIRHRVPVMRGGGELTMAAEQLIYESLLPRGDKADMLTGMAILAGLVSRELTRQLVSRRRDLMMQSYFYELVKEEGLQEIGRAHV